VPKGIHSQGEAMTLAEISEYHRKHHAGFVWSCPHCKDAWAAAKKRELQQEAKV
jgi:hypothetical protein